VRYQTTTPRIVVAAGFRPESIERRPGHRNRHRTGEQAVSKTTPRETEGTATVLCGSSTVVATSLGAPNERAKQVRCYVFRRPQIP